MNVVQAGKTPPLPFRQIREMGYRLAILPSALIVAGITAGEAALRGIRENGEVAPSNMSPLDVFRRVGADEWDAVRAKAGV